MELLKEDIINRDDRTLTKINVPEWGGHIYIRPLSGIERVAYEESVAALPKDEKNGIQVITRFLAMVLTDSKGDRLFSENDHNELAKKRWDVIMRIFNKAGRINAIDEKSIDELEKN